MPGGVFLPGIALVFYSETAKRQKVFYSKTAYKKRWENACNKANKGVPLKTNNCKTKKITVMEYRISNETAALVDAVKAVRNIHCMVYDALIKTYDEETVITMMESGFNGALDALQNEVGKFLNQSIITHVDWKGSKEI